MAEQGVYKFTTQVQLKILAVLWRDEQSYSIYKETIKPKYFQKSTHIDICRILFDYHDKYNKAPTYDVFVEEIESLCVSNKNKQKLEEEYLESIEQMAKMDLYDIDYVKDKILSFGKRQALVEAILEGADILEKKSDTEYIKIEKIVKDALLVGEGTSDLGDDLYDGIEERFVSYLNDDDVIERIPTGMVELDRILGGGGGRTEMFCVVAPPGRGKTTFLISVGGAAIESGYNVVHISLENNVKQIKRNYDMRLLRKNMDYIKENVDKSIAAMFNIKKYRKGKIKIKKYPTKSASVQTIRSYLDQLKAVEGFEPDVLIVDYGAILRPSTNYSEKRNSIETIYEDLRALADEYNLLLWTAMQGNRNSLSKRIVTMADLAECFAVGNTCDGMVCLCQTQKEKAKGDIRLFLAKVRDSADSLILKGKIQYDIKKIDFTELVQQNVEDGDDEEEEEDWE